MFGKETALFFPSGTMANQTALKLSTNPGNEIICDNSAHIYNYESCVASFNIGVSCKWICIKGLCRISRDFRKRNIVFCSNYKRYT